MDFGSRFVYQYDSSDEEFISDEEYEKGMELSDSDEEPVMAGELPPVPERTCSRAHTVFSGFAVQSEYSSEEQSSSSGFLASARRLSARYFSKPKPKIKKGLGHHWRLNKDKNTGDYCDISVVDRPSVDRKSKGRTYRRADTNVVKIKFDTLTKPSHMHTGDPEYCTQCQSVLSHLSQVTHGHGDQKEWICEFCSQNNHVDLMTEEMPRDEDVTYMLEPAPSTAATTKSGIDESLIIFCVDVSGSMCVTTEVPGKISLRGDRLQSLQSLNDEREDQYMPGQKRNVTYVSRLQGMQAAIDQQLSDMKKDHPDRRVALVSFNNEVTVIGDGSTEPVHFPKHKLTDKDELVKKGNEMSLPKSIQNSRDVLGDKVFDLEEGGATALGPALLLSVAMASQAQGSKVIICTDGMANVGVGSLDDESQEKQDEAAEFYSQVSSMATSKGVSVSVISIKGANCKLVQLGKVADETGGQVNIVDPLQLTSQFGSILAEPVIATGVVAKFITHSGLYIRDEINSSYDNSCIERVVGNVTANTVISFEFGVRSKPAAKSKDVEPTDKPVTGEGATAQPQEKEERKDEAGGGSMSTEPGPSTAQDTGEKKEPGDLPFQLQITYTDIEGAKALRVLTQAKPVTRERKVAEDHLNLGVLGTHVAQASAALASEGLYTDARSHAMMHQRLFARHKWKHGDKDKQVQQAYGKVFSKVKGLDQELQIRQQSEVRKTGRRYSDDEEEEEEEVRMRGQEDRGKGARRRRRGKALPKLSKARRDECHDDLANTTYQLKRSNFS